MTTFPVESDTLVALRSPAKTFLLHLGIGRVSMEQGWVGEMSKVAKWATFSACLVQNRQVSAKLADASLTCEFEIGSLAD